MRYHVCTIYLRVILVNIFFELFSSRFYRVNVMPLFTKENAAIFGKQGALVRWTPKPDPVTTQSIADDMAEQFSEGLAHACLETLARLRKAGDPQRRAQLARALRDLRETWHLATGKPRPGQTRPDMQRPMRRLIPREYPIEYKPLSPNGNNTPAGT